MIVLEPGDKVRIDIPDQRDPDFDRYHGRFGDVTEIIEDDAELESDEMVNPMLIG